MKTTNRLLAVLLCAGMLCMPIGTLPEKPLLTAQAATAEGTCGDDLTWSLSSDGTLTISGTGKMPDWEDEEESEFYEWQDSIRRVVCEEGVQNIGPYAFYFCERLTEVNLPESMDTICDFAFWGCRNLESVELGGTRILGAGAFCCCDGLTAVKIPQTMTEIGSMAFANSGLIRISLPKSVTLVGAGAFSDCSALQLITLLNPACEIHDDSITISNQCTYDSETGQAVSAAYNGVIEGYAGSTAESYAKKYGYTFRIYEEASDIPAPTDEPVTDPTEQQTESVEPVTDPAEDPTEPLIGPIEQPTETAESVTDPVEPPTELIERFTEIMESHYHWTVSEDDTLTISGWGDLPEWGENEQPWYSMKTGIRAIIIEDGITGISSGAFKGHMQVVSITLADSVTSIGDETFMDCVYLRELTLGSGLRTIGARAFKGCGSLNTVELPESVVSIGARAFDNCSHITDIMIHSRNCTIYDDKSTICSNSIWKSPHQVEPPSIGAVYYGTITGYAGSTAQAYAEACGYTFRDIAALAPTEDPSASPTELLTESNTEPVTERPTEPSTELPTVPSTEQPTGVMKLEQMEDGTLYIRGTGAMEDYLFTDNKPPWDNLSDVVHTIIISEGITSIGAGAFYGFTGLTSVTIPDTVTEIGDYAFYACGLTEVELPGHLDNIGVCAFSETALTEITFPESVTNVGNMAFSDCPALQTVTVLNPDCALGTDLWVFTNENDQFGGTIAASPVSTAKVYANKYGCRFQSLAPEPSDSLGDVNGDGTVNASDAAQILIAAAAIGAGQDPSLTEAQKNAADVNHDSTINASDAAVVLIYAAAIGAGQDVKIEDFVH